MGLLRPGWTLIDALASMAGLAMVAALLLPAVSAAREAAQAQQCVANHRHIHLAMEAFAVQYDGRLPGSAGWRSADTAMSRPWHDMLNAATGSRINRLGGPREGRVYCPSLPEPEGIAPRWVGMNRIANGWVWPEGPRVSGVPPQRAGRGQWSHWYLGEPIDRFRDPSFTVLTRETQASHDLASIIRPARDHHVLEHYDADTGLAFNGQFAFRHQATGVYLMLDGRVARLGPGDDVNSLQRYSLEGRRELVWP